jgi:hypothetical protein
MSDMCRVDHLRVASYDRQGDVPVPAVHLVWVVLLGNMRAVKGPQVTVG